MPVSRYSRTSALGNVRYRSTPQYVQDVRDALDSGRIPYKESYVTGAQRLDTLAGKEYGDARYWWVIALASGVGWGMQVPPGTVVKIPDLNEVLNLVA